MLVHQSQAGAVIGKGGSKIKELREVRFSWRINYYQFHCQKILPVAGVCAFSIW
jgi:ribosomal protein S3